MILLINRELRITLVRLLGPASACLLLFYAIDLLTSSLVWPGILFGLMALLSGLLSWNLHKTQITLQQGIWLGLINALALLVACVVSHQAALPWLFVIVITNYFFCRPDYALALNFAMTVGMLIFPSLVSAGSQQVSSITVALILTGLGFYTCKQLNLERSQLREAIASYDPLTRLPNEHSLERVMTHQIQTEPGRGRLNALIIIEIDQLRDVFDQFGLAVSEAILVDLALLLRRRIAKPGQIFRFSHNEFVILFPIQNYADLAATIQELKETIHESLRGPQGPLTTAIGAAMLTDEQYWHDWFSRADASLYLKKTLRNPGEPLEHPGISAGHDNQTAVDIH